MTNATVNSEVTVLHKLKITVTSQSTNICISKS